MRDLAKFRARVLGLGLVIPTCRANLVLYYLAMRHIWHGTGFLFLLHYEITVHQRYRQTDGRHTRSIACDTACRAEK